MKLNKRFWWPLRENGTIINMILSGKYLYAQQRCYPKTKLGNSPLLVWLSHMQEHLCVRKTFHPFCLRDKCVIDISVSALCWQHYLFQLWELVRRNPLIRFCRTPYLPVRITLHIVVTWELPDTVKKHVFIMQPLILCRPTICV